MKMFAVSAMRLTAARFAHDRNGVAATEFAMVVPIMLVMLFGTIEITSAVAVDRKVTLVAQSVSDLTSRATSIGDTDITNYTRIGNAVLTPLPSAPLQLTVSELYIDPATSSPRVQWSKGSVPRGVGSVAPLPTDLIAKDSSGKALPNQYLIFSEAKYLYVPIVGYVMGKAGVTLSDVAYTRPRLSTCVLYSPGTNCPTS
jgi:Flp pilus assembly protein TadG